MARNEVEIRVTADTRDAEQNIKGIAREGRQLNVNLKQLAIGAGVTAAAIGGVAFAAKSLVSAYQEQARAERTLAQVVANTGVAFSSVREDILETTAALQRKTNFGDQEQIRVLTRMTTILGSVEDAQAALPAVLDAASVSGRDAATVAETLSKALAGQANIAESVGIKFDENADFQERLAIVMEKVGGAAEANADPFTQLGNSVGDLKEALGEILVGPAIELTQWLTNVTEQSGIALKAVQDFFSGADELAAMTSNIALAAGTDPEDQAQALLAEFDKLNSELQVFRQRAEEARKAGDFKEFNFASLRAQTLGEQVDALSDKLKEIRDTQKAQEEATVSNTFAIDENAKHARLLAEAEAQAENRARELTRAITEYTDEAIRAQEETKKLAEEQAAIDQAEFDAVVAEIEESLASQRKVRAEMLKDLNKEGKEIIKTSESWRKLLKELNFNKSAVGELNLSLEDTFMVLERGGFNVQDLADRMKEAGIDADDYTAILKFLEEQGLDVAEMFKEQTLQIQAQERAMKGLERQARQAASAMADVIVSSARRTPTIVVTRRENTDPVATGIFSNLSDLRRSELATPDLQSFQQFFFNLVEDLRNAGLDRADAILSASRQFDEFQTGGVVGGPRGAPQLVLAHGGETILPTHRPGGAGMAGVVVNNDFAGATIIGIDDLEETIAASVEAALTRQTAGRSRR